MPTFKIHHITKYNYETPARDSANLVMLYPVSDDFQQVVSHVLTVTGNPIIDRYFDYFQNEVGAFSNSKSHHELIIESRCEVITSPKPLPTDNEPASAQWSEIERIKFQVPYIDFLRPDQCQSLHEIQMVIETMYNPDHTPYISAQKFCAYVFREFTYKKGITTIDTTVDEIWRIKTGVCQDFAHILLTMLRLINMPARYVSGYICPNRNGMRGEGATHAWVEAYIPFYGWLGLDPTNNCIANENHVRLAVGRNFYDCSPVRGTYRGTSNHTLEVAVSVSYENDIGAPDNQQQFIAPELSSSVSNNSFRRYQEMQMQQ